MCGIFFEFTVACVTLIVPEIVTIMINFIVNDIHCNLNVICGIFVLDQIYFKHILNMSF